MLIGLERERRKGQGELRAAGLHLFHHRVIGLCDAAGSRWRPVGADRRLPGGDRQHGSHWKSQDKDPGITSEVTHHGAGIGRRVGTPPNESPSASSSPFCWLRDKLHNFTRIQLTDIEMRDGLLLLIVALVMLPLAPDRYRPLWCA